MIDRTGCRFLTSGVGRWTRPPQPSSGGAGAATGERSASTDRSQSGPQPGHGGGPWSWRPAGLLGLLLVLLSVGLGPEQALAGADPLVVRQGQWPAWSLPAPLQRPGQADLVLPEWMLGTWSLRELEPQAPPNGERPGGAASDAPAATVSVRFVTNRRGQVVVDRAFNAFNLGRSVLGDSLLAVENDPRNPNRQLARLRGERLIDSTVIGRRRLSLDADSLLADELTLQIVHGPGQPQISQVEVLALYRRQGADVMVEQWQASYAEPGESAEARRSSHRLLLLQRSADG